MRAKAFIGILFLAALGLMTAACGVKILPVGEPARITAEKLNSLLATPDIVIVIVDVRHEVEWDESPTKIPGAVRGEAKSVAWARQYPKDTFLVLYCA